MFIASGVLAMLNWLVSDLEVVFLQTCADELLKTGVVSQSRALEDGCFSGSEFLGNKPTVNFCKTLQFFNCAQDALS